MDTKVDLAGKALDLHCWLLEMELTSDERDKLNCGLHMLSCYEQFMLMIESSMHPDYQKNIRVFRKQNGLE